MQHNVIESARTIATKGATRLLNFPFKLTVHPIKRFTGSVRYLSPFDYFIPIRSEWQNFGYPVSPTSFPPKGHFCFKTEYLPTEAGMARFAPNPAMRRTSLVVCTVKYSECSNLFYSCKFAWTSSVPKRRITHKTKITIYDYLAAAFAICMSCKVN